MDAVHLCLLAFLYPKHKWLVEEVHSSLAVLLCQVVHAVLTCGEYLHDVYSVEVDCKCRHCHSTHTTRDLECCQFFRKILVAVQAIIELLEVLLAHDPRIACNRLGLQVPTEVVGYQAVGLDDLLVVVLLDHLLFKVAFRGILEVGWMLARGNLLAEEEGVGEFTLDKGVLVICGIIVVDFDEFRLHS